MSARTPSTFKLIGAGITSLGAMAAIFGPTGTKAQTLANVNADRAAYLERHCGHIRDGAEQVGCIGAKSIEFDRAQTAVMRDRAAAANQRITEADRLQRCITFLGQKRNEGVVFDRKITRENVCPYALELGMKDGPG